MVSYSKWRIFGVVFSTLLFSVPLSSGDKSVALKLVSETKIVSDQPPVSKKLAKDGATACIVSLDSQGQFFECQGQGFKPKEQIIMSSVSSGEAILSFFEADKSGDFFFRLAPAVFGKAGGIAQVKLSRLDEVITLDYGWGKDLGK